MPLRIGRKFVFAALLLQILVVDIHTGLVESRPEYGAFPLQLQYYHGRSSDAEPQLRQQQHIEPSYTVYYGPIHSSELGGLPFFVSMETWCFFSVQQQWLRRPSTQFIQMGRSYRRLLAGSSLQEELQAFWDKCHPHMSAYDDDMIIGVAGVERNSDIALMELSTYSNSQSTRDYTIEGNILQAFLLSHPSFFLHLALVFLVLACLATLFYFSLD